ncbi:MAG: DUF6569 family protein [candidate division WOR-3 bacterium]
MKILILISIIPMIMLFAQKSDSAMKDYLDRLKIGKPIEYKNLKIYPLEMTMITGTKGFVTLDEATDKGWIKIREIGLGNVNQVEIKNYGDEPVFILTGEMITGAKQDRMIKEDILLPPNSGWIKIEVYCVEHGRWVEVSKEFKSSGLVVPNIVRQRAKLSESQGEVWAEIARTQDRLGVVSGTGTVRANYEDKKVQQTIEDYVEGFEKIPKLSDSTIGVVVTTGDKIICLDLFASNDLLHKLWKKLIKSYAMDAIGNAKSRITKEKIERFIDLISAVRLVSKSNPGLGDLFSLESEHGKGAALVYKNLIVHMDFFPAINRDQDSDLKLDFRRQQRNTD